MVLGPASSNVMAARVGTASSQQPLKVRAVDNTAFTDVSRDRTHSSSRPASPAPSIASQKRYKVQTDQKHVYAATNTGVVRSAVSPGVYASSASTSSPSGSSVGGATRPRTKSSAGLLPAASISSARSSPVSPQVGNNSPRIPATTDVRPRVRTKSVTSPAGFLPTTAKTSNSTYGTYSNGTGSPSLSPGTPKSSERSAKRPPSPAGRRPMSPSRLPPVPALPANLINTPTAKVMPLNSRQTTERVRTTSTSPSTPMPTVHRANTTPQDRQNFLAASLSGVSAKHIFPSSHPSPDASPHLTPTTHTLNGKDRPTTFLVDNPPHITAKTKVLSPLHSPTLNLTDNGLHSPNLRSSNGSSVVSASHPARSPILSNSPKTTHHRNNSASSTSNTSFARNRSNSKSSSVASNAKDDSWFENAREAERAREREREARERRKILDLEITNASLLAINATLERTKLKQGTELRDLRKRLREGGSLPPSLLSPTSEVSLVGGDVDDDADRPWSEILEEDPQFKEIARCLEALVSRGMAAAASEWHNEVASYKAGAKVLTPSFDVESSLSSTPMSATASSARTPSPFGHSQQYTDGSTGSSHLSTSLTSDTTFDLGASHSTQSSEAEAWTSGIVSPLSSISRVQDMRTTLSPSPRMYGIATPPISMQHIK